MSAKGPRIVAELGRPETASETAARKAASSAAYRGSKTFRNLIVALGVTLLVLVAIVLMVPRGEFPERASIDPTPAASITSETEGREVVLPDLPETWLEATEGNPEPWRVNAAEVSGIEGNRAWTIVYVPDATDYLRVSQAFGTDLNWARAVLGGQSPRDTVVVDGITWDRFVPSNPDSARNVSFALGTQAGEDYVLLYGTAGEQTTTELAELLTDQITTLQNAAPEEDAS